jgi:DNA-binding IclR family transcriptional regulator
VTQEGDSDPAIRGSGNGVAAVDRAFKILFAFTPEDSTVGLSELAERTGLYKSTILRLVGSLLRWHLLIRLADGRYRLGPGALQLGAVYQQSHRSRDVFMPILQELAEATGESVAYYVREGDGRVCLHRVDSAHVLRYHVREGDFLPLTVGSGGRVLAAFAGAPGEPYETIRTRFFYSSVGERDRDIAGMSVPVFTVGQAVAGALTVAGPSTRLDEEFFATHLPALLAAAAEATTALGGNPVPLQQERPAPAAKPARNGAARTGARS